MDFGYMYQNIDLRDKLKTFIKADCKMQMYSTSCSTDFKGSVLLPDAPRILTDILLKFS